MVKHFEASFSNFTRIPRVEQPHSIPLQHETSLIQHESPFGAGDPIQDARNIPIRPDLPRSS